MKLTLPLTALVALLGLAFASASVQAADATPAATTAAAPTKAKKSDKTQYAGTLTAVDTTANTVTVQTTSKKNGDKTLTLTVNATTKISRERKPATLAEFKTGDKVTGSYSTDASGAMTAATLNFNNGKTKTKPAATTPAPATPAAQ